MNEIEQWDPDSPPKLTPGQMLKVQRERSGLTVEEVATSLNLGPGVIRALESDDYSALPGTTFVKGYFRSCAKLLGLDPDELVGAIDSNAETVNVQVPGATERPAGYRRREAVRPRKQNPAFWILRWSLVFLLLGLLAVGLISQWPRFGIERMSDLFSFAWMNPQLSSESHQTTQFDDEASRPALQALPQDNQGNAGSQEQSQGDIIRIE